MKAKETHGLSKIMRARHESKTCDWGCPHCKREEVEAKKAEEQAHLNRLEVYEIMPRKVNAKGLEFQAGIYVPSNGNHILMAEVYETITAIAISDVMTVLSCRYFDGVLVRRSEDGSQARYSAEFDYPIPSSFPADSVWQAMHDAAEYLRRLADSRLDEHRADVMKHRGLKGEWGKWE